MYKHYKLNQFIVLWIFVFFSFYSLTFAESGNIEFIPKNNAVNVNPDTRLVITFQKAAILGNSGKIKVFDASNDSLVDELDLSIPPGPKNTRTPSPYDTLKYSGVPDITYTVYNPDTNTAHVYQENFIGGNSDADVYHFFSVLINQNMATICLHNNHLDYNKTYYVLIDADVFPLNDGSFSGIIEKINWTFSTKITPPSLDSGRYVVSADGNNDFNTIQGAIDYIPDNYSKNKTISIKNGIYEEIVYFRNKKNITFFGENRDSVIVRYANNGVFNYKNISPEPGVYYHNIRAVFAVHNSSDINLVNFTIQSVGESPAQAEGLLTKGERIQVHNITILGSGDALQATGQIYISESSIRGYGDNVLGYGAIFFNRCDFISTYGPHLYVRNANANHGNVLYHCKLWTEGNVETDFARAPVNHGITYPYAEAVLINCEIEGVRAGGWGDVCPERENIHYWEYNSINLDDWKPADISKRVSYSRQLTMENDSIIIANYSDPSYVLGGWNPEYPPDILPQPDSMKAYRGRQAEISVRAAVAPKADYQWYKNGNKLVNETNRTIRLESVTIDDEGEYSVTIENSLGNDSGYVVTLITEEAPVIPPNEEDSLPSVIIKKKENSMIKIYPNPFTEQFKISSNTKINEVSVFDITGNLIVQKENINQTNINISLTGFPKGVYLLYLTSLNSTKFEKLIKQY